MKKRLTDTDIINWWLEKFHNTNIAKLLKEHPDWEKDPQAHTKEFYDMHKVTQEQHDEWREWAITALAKERRLSKRYIKMGFWVLDLNAAPSIDDNREA